MTEFQIFHCLIPSLSSKYVANQYDILLKNCNHFTDELLTKITGGEYSLPPFLNRVAYLGSFFHCIVPRKFLTVTPLTTRGNAIESMNSEVNRSSSSYSLLGQENVLQWTLNEAAGTAADTEAGRSGQAAGYSQFGSYQTSETGEFPLCTNEQEAQIELMDQTRSAIESPRNIELSLPKQNLVNVEEVVSLGDSRDSL